MNPLTYLGFTIFSIIMQFCVMEFINERFKLDKYSANFNESIPKNNFIKDINRRPHALFYRTETDKITLENNNHAESVKYANTSLDDTTVITSTDITSTEYEVYYENTSIIEDFFSTESYSTSSEFDNVTEITLLTKSNATTAKPSVNKRVNIEDNCFCNLLYQKCDINCCCDTDCTEEEQSLFIGCDKDESGKFKKGIYFSNSYSTCRNTISTNLFNDLFCVAKVNLPDKRIKSHFQLDMAAVNATFKWDIIEKSDINTKFGKNKYEYGYPLWLLKDGALSSISLPTALTNYYCNGKKEIQFLINENIKCYVKLNDVYMFSALKILEETKLISVTELSNTTVLNCSTLHCTNLSVLACNENNCVDYNKTIHVPMCTDNYCNNVAHTVEYTFYYFDSKIINASLKLHLTKIPMSVPIILQKITVKWYLGNETIDKIIELSGNPGYIPGLPLIVSPALNNHTSNFYNQTYGKSFIPFPRNVNGKCNWSYIKNKTLLFGLNTRSKCRLNINKNISFKNATGSCHTIQININEHLRLNHKLFISPYGNPQNISDAKWIPLEVYDSPFLYGEYRSKNTELICYNLVPRYEFLIVFADTGDVHRVNNKIVKATADATLANVTFDTTQLSTVLTIDVRFIDISKPITEFARAPNLNIHLPPNIFFDYPSNNCNHYTARDIVLVIFVLHCLLLTMK